LLTRPNKMLAIARLDRMHFFAHDYAQRIDTFSIRGVVQFSWVRGGRAVRFELLLGAPKQQMCFWDQLAFVAFCLLRVGMFDQVWGGCICEVPRRPRAKPTTFFDQLIEASPARMGLADTGDTG
jgi:hypothetical protein